jgi:hypothetical protein
MAPRIEADIDYDEEAQLFLLETGSSLPSELPPRAGGATGGRGRGRGIGRGCGRAVGPYMLAPAVPMAAPMVILDPEAGAGNTVESITNEVWGRQSHLQLGRHPPVLVDGGGGRWAYEKHRV